LTTGPELPIDFEGSDLGQRLIAGYREIPRFESLSLMMKEFGLKGVGSRVMVAIMEYEGCSSRRAGGRSCNIASRRTVLETC